MNIIDGLEAKIIEPSFSARNKNKFIDETNISLTKISVTDGVKRQRKGRKKSSYRIIHPRQGETPASECSPRFVSNIVGWLSVPVVRT